MPARAYAYRGLPLADLPTRRQRAHRALEVCGDCYGDSESARALPGYRAAALPDRFLARWHAALGLGGA